MPGPPLTFSLSLPPPFLLNPPLVPSLMPCHPTFPPHLLSLCPPPCLSPPLPLVSKGELPLLTLIPLPSSLAFQVALTLALASAVGSARKGVIRRMTAPGSSQTKGPLDGPMVVPGCNTTGGMTCWTRRAIQGISVRAVGSTSVPLLQVAGPIAPWSGSKCGKRILLTLAPLTMKGMRQMITSKSVEATLG